MFNRMEPLSLAQETDTLLVTMVNAIFIDADISNFCRLLICRIVSRCLLYGSSWPLLKADLMVIRSDYLYNWRSAPIDGAADGADEMKTSNIGVVML
jgi:hypothetical protein